MVRHLCLTLAFCPSKLRRFYSSRAPKFTSRSFGMPRIVAISLLVAFLSAFLSAQSDPQALALVSQAMNALTGGQPVADVTMAGMATEIAGSEITTGAVTLRAKGYWQS